MRWVKLPHYLHDHEVPLPSGWSAHRVEDISEQLAVGQRRDTKSCGARGAVPVIDQSENGILGWHDDEPGVDASDTSPVVTFANHTCEMRLLHRPFSVIQNVFPKVGREPVCSTRFFYYLMKGRVRLTDYKGHHPIFRSAWVPVPPRPVQDRIVEILSAYDDLIENCERRIRILDDMARALYREWFVDFRYPGHENIPLVDSPLGPIPRGWSASRMDQLADIRGGKQLDKTRIAPTGLFPVFGGNGIQGYTHEATQEGFVIAFGRVGANCGSVHWSYGGAWLNNNASAVVPVANEELVLQHLRAFDFAQVRGGAAQPFIANGALAAIEFVWPDEATATAFCDATRRLLAAAATLSDTSRNLRSTRDLLLPRLLSGELSTGPGADE